MSGLGQALGIGGLLAVLILAVMGAMLGLARFVGRLLGREEERPGYLPEELIRRVRE